MSTRTRTSAQQSSQDFLYDNETLDLEALSNDELEALLFEEEPEKPKGFFNLPTMAGLSLIVVGIGYLLQKLGLLAAGIDLTVLAQMLPWLAGILIILLGFGVLSWRPGKSRRRAKAEKKLAKSQLKAEKARDRHHGARTAGKLYKSRDKKVSGVAGGIAEYFGIDPTLVRIGFVIGMIASSGSFLFAYVLMAFLMPSEDKQAFKADPKSSSERITIIRDS